MITFIAKLFKSIFTSDWPILAIGILTVGIFLSVKKLTTQVNGEVTKYKYDKSLRFAIDLSNRLNARYNLFTTMITIFPLLGMLGTVKALIELDLANGATPELQAHFFDALTSTAWGIVFAIGFKVANATIEYSVLSTIDAAQKIIEKLEPINEMKDGVEANE